MYKHIPDSEVNKYKLTEMDIVNWLLEGDIHFIISHIHQGIVKLHDHPGFPSGDNLQCPVFTQDKYKYLSVLMSKGLCNPTLKVDFFTDNGLCSSEAGLATVRYDLLLLIC
jgi:hypothetical protein